MINQPRWEEVKSRMLAYWNRENTDRCCYAMRVKKPGFEDFGEYNFYFETERADAMHRGRFENHDYLGEAFPCLFPYFGTAGIAEYTGCKPNRTPRTTWYDHWMADADEPDAELIGFTHPEAFEAQKQAIRELLELSKGDYTVSVTDNAGVLDALAEVRGTENLMMDMITDPDFVHEGLNKLLPIYKQTQEELFSLVENNNDGCVLSWMQLWAPKRIAQLQCDMCVMLSNEMFDEFVMPELEELCEFLDYPVYHFDGQEQIRHLDSMLRIEKLRAIQWTPVAGQSKTSTCIPVLQKIQKAGKNLILFPQADEIEVLLDNLSCVGLHLVIDGISSEEEAQRIVKLIETHSKVR